MLHKSVPTTDIVDAIRRLASGGELISPDEVIELLRFASRQRERDHKAQRAVEQLTPREREVLQALAEGLSDKEIAERLGINPGTARNYVRGIFSKLGVHWRLEALVFALRHRIVEIV